MVYKPTYNYGAHIAWTSDLPKFDMHSPVNWHSYGQLSIYRVRWFTPGEVPQPTDRLPKLSYIYIIYIYIYIMKFPKNIMNIPWYIQWNSLKTSCVYPMKIQPPDMLQSPQWKNHPLCDHQSRNSPHRWGRGASADHVAGALKVPIKWFTKTVLAGNPMSMVLSSRFNGIS